MRSTLNMYVRMYVLPSWTIYTGRGDYSPGRSNVSAFRGVHHKLPPHKLENYFSDSTTFLFCSSNISYHISNICREQQAFVKDRFRMDRGAARHHQGKNVSPLPFVVSFNDLSLIL